MDVLYVWIQLQVKQHLTPYQALQLPPVKHSLQQVLLIVCYSCSYVTNPLLNIHSQLWTYVTHPAHLECFVRICFYYVSKSWKLQLQYTHFISFIFIHFKVISPPAGHQSYNYMDLWIHLPIYQYYLLLHTCIIIVTVAQ